MSQSVGSPSTTSLSRAWNVILKNPLVLIPALVPFIVEILFGLLGFVFPGFYWVGLFIAFILGWLALFVTVDMSNDAAKQQTPDLNRSLNAVTSRFGDLFLSALIAAVLAITVVLLPVALFIVVITVVEKTDAAEGTRRAFDFILKNLGEVIIFIIFVIAIAIVALVFSLIPFVGVFLGAIIRWFLVAYFVVSSVFFYLSLRQTTVPPPPPVPPPP